jgi:hypothetical protein
MKSYLLATCCLLLGTTCTLHAQVLRGQVRDVFSQRPVPGATLRIESDAKKSKKYTATTDSSGTYRVEGIRAGTYRVVAEKDSFGTETSYEVQVAAGKVRTLDFWLEAGDADKTLRTVDVVARHEGRTPQLLGEIPLDREQVLRYPATFFDPVRLAAAFSGVAQVDDGTNSVSVRGNNPAFMRWRLEGCDIVSPNHLPNAGTFNDLPAASSGGVLMLSSQMLDHSALVTGGGGPEVGDAMGGLMDMRLRRGNTERHESTVQLGLIGLDAAVEGPFSKTRNAGSFLFNYRYSTVGLLSKLGVSFGGEAITFQDLAVHVHFPGRIFDHISAYYLLGNSSNVFTKPDSAVVYKDRFDIDFRSRTSVFGLRGEIDLGLESYLTTALSVSRQSNSRTQFGSPLDTLTGDFESVDNRETRIQMNVEWKGQFFDKIKIATGGNINTHVWVKNQENDGFVFDYIRSRLFVTGWLTSRYNFADGAGLLQIGAHPIISVLSADGSFDPRFQLSYRLGPQHQIALSAGKYSQHRPIGVRPITDNGNVLMHSSQAGLRYTFFPKKDKQKWTFHAEAFRQAIGGVEVSDEVGSNAYSLINDLELAVNTTIRSGGQGLNYGLELGINRYFSGGHYWNLNGTLLRSRVRSSDLVWRDSRWAVGHITNLVVGREWAFKNKKKSKKTRHWGLNTRLVYAGGLRAMPIDALQSAAEARTIFVPTEGFTEQYPNYFRADGRVYWKWSLADRRNSTLALEFQNLSAQKNVAYRYYDPLTRQVTTKYQLGLIPNLNWRVEF